MREKNPKSAGKKNNCKIIPTHCPPPTPWYKTTTPTYLPIFYNNNTMGIEFLVQMKKSNKCGSVRNGEIFNLHLRSDPSPWVSIPCLLQDVSHIYWFHPPKPLTRKKQGAHKWDSIPNKLYCSAFAYIGRTQG